MLDKLCMYIGNTKLFIWYTNGTISKNWGLIAFILIVAFIISDLKFNKPDSYILKLWQFIKVLDQRTTFIYEKRDSSNPARFKTISDKSINKNITQKIKLFKWGETHMLYKKEIIKLLYKIKEQQEQRKLIIKEV